MAENDLQTCVNHPERETRFKCTKYDIAMCEECLKCRDPKIYCKFRSSCPIWFLTEKGGRDLDEAEMTNGFK